jgi:hypothetical protein
VSAVRRLVVVVGVVTIAAGITIAGGFPSEPAPDVAPPPSVARVVCETGGAVLRAPTVVAARDGVHLAVTNASGADLLEIRSATDEPLAETPLDLDALTNAVFQIPPGPVTVTCGAGDAGASVLQILDPRERWVSPTLACGEEEVERVELTTEEIPGEPAVGTARRAVPGLRGSDELEKPGYPGSLWHGDLLVVIREGEVVGRITRAQNRGEWSVVVTACPGSGLTDA